MTKQEIIKVLKSSGSERNRAGMKRFGINVDRAFGVRMDDLRALAKKIDRNHELALELWDTGYHEARMLAGLIDDPAKVTKSQMDQWANDFDSWDLCDTVCGALFDKTPFAYEKALSYTSNKKEFVKRVGFVMYAWLAVHDKKADDKVFIDFFKVIKREANDERNFVRKAVNWALRQIGKRNEALRVKAIACAQDILKLKTKSARWIASNAITELQSEKTIQLVKRRSK